MKRAVFFDVDGVLLDYDKGLFSWLSEQGVRVPEQCWRNRERYRLCESFPERWPGPEAEMRAIYGFGDSGGMARLEPMSQSASQAALLPNCFALSRFPEHYREDRCAGLASLGFRDFSKVFRVYGQETKQAFIRDFCRRRGLRLQDVLLVEDSPGNLLKDFGNNLLVTHSYNRAVELPANTRRTAADTVAAAVESFLNEDWGQK